MKITDLKKDRKELRKYNYKRMSDNLFFKCIKSNFVFKYINTTQNGITFDTKQKRYYI